MLCPFCESDQIMVVNSRPSKSNTQIWRRRKCLKCQEVFTTHEKIDLSHVIVIKNSGKKERFSRAKLYAGIFGASLNSSKTNKKIMVEEITEEVEKDLLKLKRKELKSWEIAEIVIKKLAKRNLSSFLRFLAYNKKIRNKSWLLREIGNYLISGVKSTNE